MYKLKKYFLTAIAAISTAGAVSGQNPGKYAGYYRNPLDIKIMLSANFAETRPNHFHSGIDIKTQGVEGKRLYAAAEGYIARIGIAPSGYGRVLYIAHPNGTTTVYAHMQKFTDEVEQYVDEQRHRLRQHRVDLTPPVGRFRVEQGDFIGNAGNSGSSAGPHLHFEIRETASQIPINVITNGIYEVKDDLPPVIVRLHYIETDTVDGVAVHAAARVLDVKKINANRYALADTAAVTLGEKGYFVLETTDRKNESPNNTMGVYRVSMDMDGRRLFGFSLDKFSFAQTRYVNSLCHFAMQRGQRNQFITMAVQENNKLPFYIKDASRGVLNLKPGMRHNISIEVEDDNGNISTIAFPAVRRMDETRFWSQRDTAGIPVMYDRKFTRNNGGLSVTIPAGSLYESIFYRQTEEADPTVKGAAAGFNLHSPVYNVHTAGIPLHTAMSISIRVPDQVPDNIRKKLCLATLSPDGSTYYYAGGTYGAGRIYEDVRTFGRYCLVEDSTPPTITASFNDGADLSTAGSMTFTIKDDFSGIGSFDATIDGRWIPFEQTVSKGTITHFFNPDRITYDGSMHKVELTVTDNRGNKSTKTWSFRR